jgi:hypothetical protein
VFTDDNARALAETVSQSERTASLCGIVTEAPRKCCDCRLRTIYSKFFGATSHEKYRVFNAKCSKQSL